VRSSTQGQYEHGSGSDSAGDGDACDEHDGATTSRRRSHSDGGERRRRAAPAEPPINFLRRHDCLHHHGHGAARSSRAPPQPWGRSRGPSRLGTFALSSRQLVADHSLVWPHQTRLRRYDIDRGQPPYGPGSGRMHVQCTEISAERSVQYRRGSRAERSAGER
jgi:hypothetical protein